MAEVQTAHVARAVGLRKIAAVHRREQSRPAWQARESALERSLSLRWQALPLLALLVSSRPQWKGLGEAHAQRWARRRFESRGRRQPDPSSQDFRSDWTLTICSGRHDGKSGSKRPDQDPSKD